MDSTILKIKFTKQFKKSRKKFMSSGDFNINLVDELIFKLANKEELPTKHHDHVLKGNWNGYRECHIQSNLLLIYKYEDEELILTDIGTHSELFGR